MRTEPDQVLDAAGPHGEVLRVVFAWRGDRFGHAVLALRPGAEPRVLLESLEGAAGDAWPSSPALQSLRIEALPQGRAALLVGMAGQSHWSASVEAVPGRAELRFDVACRHGIPCGWLGSRYHVRDGSGSGWQAVAAEADLLMPAEHEVAIVPRPGWTAPRARWKYSVILPSPAGTI